MKNIVLVFSIILVLCFMVSCQNKAEKAELEKFRLKAQIEEQNMALCRKLVEELNKGNIDFVREINAPDYAFYFPSSNPVTMNTDEVITMIKTNLASAPDANWSVEEQAASGDVVFTRIIVRGTHTAEYQGLPATGNKFELSVLNWSRWKDEKIIEEREEADMLGYMQQIGMEVRPKQPEKK